MRHTALPVILREPLGNRIVLPQTACDLKDRPPYFGFGISARSTEANGELLPERNEPVRKIDRSVMASAKLLLIALDSSSCCGDSDSTTN